MNKSKHRKRNRTLEKTMSYTRNVLLIFATLLLAPFAQANQQSSQLGSQQPPLAGYIGIGVGKLSPPVRAHMPENIPENQGLTVAWLADISPGADDGVKLHDVVLSYDGKPVVTPESFIYTVRQDTPGREVKVIVVRQGKVLTLPITLGSQIKRPEFDRQPINRAQVSTPQQTQQLQSGFPPKAIPSNPLPQTSAMQQAQRQRSIPLNITGKPAYPMRKKPKKEAWGDERNIWSDFYTDSTGDMWDNMINAPFKMGRMPGGWRAPSWSSPDPVTVGDAVLNQVPPIMEEAGNMADFTD